jgi:hypothetical protein
VRALLLLTLAACGTAAPAVSIPPKKPVAVSFPDDARPLPHYHSARLALSLPLPDGHAWRIDDHRTPWLSATHAASGSSLLVRSWVEDGRVDRHRCEERARLWKAFPETARAESVQERSIDAPPGYDTFVSVGVVPGRPNEPLAGFALAFGGHAHRCFAWAFATTASGADAASVIGERLATMVDGSLGKVVVESKLAPVLREAPEFQRP